MAVSVAAVASPRQIYGGLVYAMPSPPTQGPALSQSAASATLPTGTYYVSYAWQYTAPNGTYVITSKSPDTGLNISTAGNQLTVTLPSFPVGVSGAVIYVGSSTGNETSQLLTSSTTCNLTTPLQAGQAFSTTTPQMVVYTAPNANSNISSPSATAYIKEIIICNFVSTSATVNIKIDNVPLLWSVPIGGYDTKVLSGLNIMMNPGSTLVIHGTYGSLSAYVSGVEVQ